MQRRLEERRLGALVPPEAGAALGPRPAAFARACCGDAALVARLARTAELPGHSGAVTAASWAEAGELLVTGGEDCRLKVWNLQRLHTAKHGVECTVESVRPRAGRPKCRPGAARYRTTCAGLARLRAQAKTHTLQAWLPAAGGRVRTSCLCWVD